MINRDPIPATDTLAQEKAMRDQDAKFQRAFREAYGLAAPVAASPVEPPAPLPAPREATAVRDPKIPLTGLQVIARDVCREDGVTLADLKGPSRVRRISHARQKFMARAVDAGRYSLPQIGRFVNRDHTTVLHGDRAYKLRAGAQGEDVK